MPLLLIETFEEKRAVEMLLAAAPRDDRKLATPVFQWTVTDGVRRLDVDLGGAQRHNAEAHDVLKSIRAGNNPAIYVLLDFHPFLAEPVNVRLIKDICQDYARCPRTIVLISHELTLPRELEHLAARFRLAFPGREERHAIIEGVAADWARANGGRVRTDRTALELLVENLAGLSTSDAGRLARKAIFDDGALLPSDLPGVMQAKYAMLNRHGVMSFEHDTLRFADLGGMARLKHWLEQRRPALGTSDLPHATLRRIQDGPGQGATTAVYSMYSREEQHCHGPS